MMHVSSIKDVVISSGPLSYNVVQDKTQYPINMAQLSWLSSLLLLLLAPSSLAQTCNGFRKAACPLTENNTIAFDNQTPSLQSCQHK